MDTYSLVVTRLKDAVTAAMNKAIEQGELPKADLPAFIIEIPADNKNGDFATNAAMAGAKCFRMPPFKIAKAITDATGTSQNTEGIIMNDFCFMLVKDGPPKDMAGPSVKVVRSGMLTQHLQSCSCCE